MCVRCFCLTDLDSPERLVNELFSAFLGKIAPVALVAILTTNMVCGGHSTSKG